MSKTKTTKVKGLEITQPEGQEVAPKILAEHIVKISEAMERINNTGLKRRAILLLIRDDTNIGLDTIDSVLRALENLKTRWTK